MYRRREASPAGLALMHFAQRGVRRVRAEGAIFSAPHVAQRGVTSDDVPITCRSSLEPPLRPLLVHGPLQPFIHRQIALI